MIGRLGRFNDPADVGGGLALSDQLLSVLSLRMFCSAVWRIRFMVESPAQSARMRTLIKGNQFPRFTSDRQVFIEFGETTLKTIFGIERRAIGQLIGLQSRILTTHIGKRYGRDLTSVKEGWKEE